MGWKDPALAPQHQCPEGENGAHGALRRRAPPPRLHAAVGNLDRSAGAMEIDVRVVDLTSILNGEYAENVDRKDFTPSERVAIMDTIERKRRGGLQSADLPNEATASKLSGFPSQRTANNARRVVKNGVDPADATAAIGE